MKRKRTNITDLNVDVLKCIMSFVAKSLNGAGSFARAISVSEISWRNAKYVQRIQELSFCKFFFSFFNICNHS
ncbi:hypothetical protein ACSBR1_004298 [Camellia fascicularis]